jgi:hypothetical protein
MSKLPRDLLKGGSSVALISHQPGEGTLAHKPASRTREIIRRGLAAIKETYYVTACAGSARDADEAYLLSAAWADRRGVDACPESACFPDA